MSGLEILVTLFVWVLVGVMTASIGLGIGVLLGEAKWGMVIGALVGFFGWWLFAGVYLSEWERRGGNTP